MEEPVDIGARTHFRIRTATVALKVDIHPPFGLNINHVEGESSHSRHVQQGQEIIHYIVFKELKRAGIRVPEQSLLFKKLLHTSSGFVLLRWEALCKGLHSFMVYSSAPAALPEYINHKCHCARRLRPRGCAGFLCLVLAQLQDHTSFHQRISLLLYHTVCASRWALCQEQPLLLDRILTDAVRAMDSICSEHDDKCQDGWMCILSMPRPFFSMNYLLYHGRLKHPRPLVLAFGTGVLTTIFLYKLFAGRMLY